MKKYLFYFILLLLSACEKNTSNNSQSSNVDTNKRSVALIDSTQLKLKIKNNNEDSISYLTQEVAYIDFIQVQKRNINKLLTDTLRFSKKDGKITLPTSNHLMPIVIFKDSLPLVSPPDPETKNYKYVGQFTSIGIYLVKGCYWEHCEDILIDKISGEQFQIWDNPKLTGNDSLIVSFPIIFDGYPHGIYIWEVTKYKYRNENGSRISKLGYIQNKNWDILDAIWDIDNSIIIKVNLAKDGMSYKERLSSKNIKFYRIKI